MSNNLSEEAKERLYDHVNMYLDGVDPYYGKDICKAIEAAYMLGLEDGWNNGKTK
jgi:hypothetical protein